MRIVFFLVLVSVVSCVTQSIVSPAVADYAIHDKSPEEIIEGFLSENPIEAITLSQQFTRRNLISAEQAQAFIGEALQEAQKRVQKLYDDEDYAGAWVVAENTRIAGGSVPRKLRYNILVERVEYFLTKKNYPAVIQTVDLIEEIASAEIKKLATYQRMLNERKKAQAVFPSLSRKIDKATPMKDLLASTFIVDINNGIQIAADGSGPRIARGIGSAFFITTDGYAITNKHVISTEVDPEYEGISEMKVRLPVDDFTTRPAQVVGYDEVLDLALIKVPFSPKHAFSLQAPQSEVGDTVIAIGSPLGLTNTVTSGIISGKDRAGILVRGGVFQIDASINSGNSGGPVVNENRNVIGVVFSKVDEIADKKFEGLGFVIPSDMVQMVLARLFEGKVEHAWLGAGVFEVEGGLEVVYIHPSAIINRSALRVGDVITHINDEPVSKIVDAQKLLLQDVPNKLYALRVISREKKETEVQFSLKSSEKIYEEAQKQQLQDSKEAESADVTKENVQSMLVQSVALEKEIIKPQSKATLYTVFPILTGANIEVTRYSSFRPIYRVTRVFPDTLAEHIRLSAGDMIAIRAVRQRGNLIQVVVHILQQSRGYLDSTIVITLAMNARNFI